LAKGFGKGYYKITNDTVPVCHSFVISTVLKTLWPIYFWLFRKKTASQPLKPFCNCMTWMLNLLQYKIWFFGLQNLLFISVPLYSYTIFPLWKPWPIQSIVLSRRFYSTSWPYVTLTYWIINGGEYILNMSRPFNVSLLPRIPKM